ncbi:MAG: hypothetical protein AB7F59_11850 [Bdellovibrionales bacterium]
MNKTEALAVANVKILELRRQPYQELKKLIGPQGAMTVEAVGASGTKYQLQIEAFWDGNENGNLRVAVMVDDGGFFRSMFPLSTDFIISPNGNFIGE